MQGPSNWEEEGLGDSRLLSLLVRSECVAPDRLQETCDRLAAMMQAFFTNTVNGRIHILPAWWSLEWLEYPPEVVTAGIVTAAAFGENWVLSRLPVIAEPTIVIECLLGRGVIVEVLEEAIITAPWLTQKFTSFLAICELTVQEIRLIWVP